MITVKTSSKGKSTDKFLKNLKKRTYLNKLKRYGQLGVDALSSATPIDTGLTADSWYYEIVENSNGVTIFWNNSNVNKGVPIALILDTGHATGTGGYVQGKNYIAPSIRPIFDKIAKDAWEEVTNS